ncbi:MAG TPA: sulfatase [Acidimicrobiia bacterium]
MRTALGVALAGALVAGSVGSPVRIPLRVASREAPERPNIVVLMTDDQTAESLRYLPNVQRLLVAQGTTFENHFASYPLCCPARATYLTGQYSHNHDVTYNEGTTGGYTAFRGRRRIVPVALQRVGYTTIHIGKYLNGYGLLHPTDVPAGWDDWQATVDPTTYRYYGFVLNQNGRLNGFPPHEYQTEVETRLAMLAIRRHERSRHPFFLDVAFLAPHAVQRETSGLDPLDERAVGPGRRRHGIRYPVPERRDRGKFDGVPVPDTESFAEADVSDKPLDIQQRPLFTPREAASIVENYHLRLETLLAVDRGVARIVHALTRAHHLRDTYIIFVSDNGFFHGEHRVPFGKYLPYEPSIRVPLVIRGPYVREGVTSGALTSDVDLPATILELAEARPPRRLDGRSLVPLLRGHRLERRRRAVLLESGRNNVGAPVYSGLRTRRYKYVEYLDGERELYDLRLDPHELTNVAGAPAVRAVQRRLARQLARVRACRGDACP